MKVAAHVVTFGFVAAFLYPSAAWSLTAYAIAHDESMLDTFKNCTKALNDPTEQTDFETSEITIRDGYPVKLLSGKIPGAQKKQNKTRIVIWIEDGPGGLTENPRITAVCIGSSLKPKKPGKKYGDIDFKSSPGDDILIRFHLESLKISKWKKKNNNGVDLANDSVLMTDFPEGTPPPKPDRDHWPDCAKPKTVPVSGIGDTDVSFDFSPCANPGKDSHGKKHTLWYVYALLLDQISGSGTSTEYPIDPLIINRPH